ncbi:hypothetical protein OH807_35505 [Kitasatospora sp. NBC_01560]|uniref:hypothetical protein n=1 Tax=Kitasatospora sp. NBC_01560 TaxID=2975965 RepID=UPI003866CE91
MELSFSVDGDGVPPSPETIETGIRRSGRRTTARLEHLRVRRTARGVYLVLFLSVTTADDAGALARAIGSRVDAEHRQLHYIGQRVWTGNDFRAEGTGL